MGTVPGGDEVGRSGHHARRFAGDAGVPLAVGTGHGPPYRSAWRLLSLVVAHFPVLDARFQIDAGCDPRDLTVERGLNIAYVLLVRSMSEDDHRQFDEWLAAPDETEPAASDTSADDDDWRPDWWTDDLDEQADMHEAHIAEYSR